MFSQRSFHPIYPLFPRSSSHYISTSFRVVCPCRWLSWIHAYQMPEPLKSLIFDVAFNRCCYFSLNSLFNHCTNALNVSLFSWCAAWHFSVSDRKAVASVSVIYCLLLNAKLFWLYSYTLRLTYFKASWIVRKLFSLYLGRWHIRSDTKRKKKTETDPRAWAPIVEGGRVGGIDGYRACSSLPP